MKNYLVDKRALLRVFLILLGVLVAIVSINRSKISLRLGSQQPSNQVSPPRQDGGATFSTQNTKILEMPVEVGAPNVGAVFIHYFFTGTISEIKQSPEGTRIILSSENKDLPVFLVTKETRVSKISPPYSESTSSPLSVSKLKSGQTIDISAEYEVASKQWIIRDVFFPVDRN